MNWLSCTAIDFYDGVVAQIKHMIMKIALSLLLLGIVGVLLFVYIRGGNTNLINSSGRMPLPVALMGIAIAVIVAMFFPEDIKTYSAANKWIIGVVTFIILIVVVFFFFILSAFLFG